MSFEDRIRKGLKDEAGGAAPTPNAWDAVRRGARTKRRRRAAGSSLVAVAAIAAVVGVTLVGPSDGDEPRIQTPAGVEATPSEIVAVTTDERLVLLDSAGAELRILASEVNVGLIAVSEDNVFFTRKAGDTCSGLQIVTVPLDGGPEMLVVDNAAWPAVSPDGSKLAFVSFRSSAGCEGSGSLGLKAIADLQSPTLFGPGWTASDPNAGVIAPTWAPDSRSLGFVYSGPAGPDFRTFDTETFTASLDEARAIPGLTVIPVGRRVVHRADGLISAVVETGTDDPAVVTIDPVTGVQSDPLFHVGTYPTSNPRYFDTDPTGTSVLVTLDAGDEKHLYRWHDGDPQPTKIADGILAAVWAPEAPEPAPEKIVAATEDGRLVVLDAVTGSELRTLATGSAGSVAVTPDGERVIFDRPSSAESDPPREIATVPVAGGAVERLIGGAGQPAISADGRLLAFTRYEQPWPGNYQPRSMIVVELPTRFTDWVPNVVADGTITDGTGVIALSWAPDSRHLLYTVIGTAEGSPPRVAEIETEMVLDRVPPIPLVIEGRGCAEATYLGATGLVASVREGERVVAIDPVSGAEVRELFRGEWLNCVSQAPVSDVTGRHVLYAGGGSERSLYRWSEGDAMPTLVAPGIVGGAWVPSGQRPLIMSMNS